MCKIKNQWHAHSVLRRLFRDVFALQGVVVQVRGENMERALGEIVLSTQEQFHAQPSRKRAIAVAVGRDSVDIVVATKQESGSVTYQHSTQQSMDLSSDSPGLQHFVAALTASPEASGYMSMEPAYPPSKQIEYVGPSAPLKYVVSDQPPLSTQVYQVNIKKPGSSEPEAAILKIGWSPLIDTEVCSPRVCVTAVKGHMERMQTH